MEAFEDGLTSDDRASNGLKSVEMCFQPMTAFAYETADLRVVSITSRSATTWTAKKASRRDAKRANPINSRHFRSRDQLPTSDFKKRLAMSGVGLGAVQQRKVGNLGVSDLDL